MILKLKKGRFLHKNAYYIRICGLLNKTFKKFLRGSLISLVWRFNDLNNTAQISCRKVGSDHRGDPIFLQSVVAKLLNRLVFSITLKLCISNTGEVKQKTFWEQLQQFIQAWATEQGTFQCIWLSLCIQTSIPTTFFWDQNPRTIRG